MKFRVLAAICGSLLNFSALAAEAGKTGEPAETRPRNDAKQCIELQQISHYGKQRQRFTNTCDYTLQVVWCHKNKGDEFITGLCGRNGRFYQHKVTLRKEQSFDNYNMLPADTAIIYGACKGDLDAVVIVDEEGTYRCVKNLGDW